MLSLGYFESVWLMSFATFIGVFIIDVTVVTPHKRERYESRYRHPVNHQPKPKPYDYRTDNNK